MTKLKMLVRASAVAAFAFTAYSFTPPPAHAAKVCKSAISGSGLAKYKIANAKNKAREAWRGAARAAHGKKFDKWHKAEDKSVNCSKPGLKWNCTATAKPCGKG